MTSAVLSTGSSARGAGQSADASLMTATESAMPAMPPQARIRRRRSEIGSPGRKARIAPMPSSQAREKVEK
jgi:hypothetical protein